MEQRRHKWEDNIKMYVNGTGCKGKEGLVHLAQDRGQCWAPVKRVINLRVA